MDSLEWIGRPAAGGAENELTTLLITFWVRELC
jgi:hypothetical protein